MISKSAQEKEAKTAKRMKKKKDRQQKHPANPAAWAKHQRLKLHRGKSGLAAFRP
ncbi:hypothetical protein [Cesiribacter sp. SM1]|uniref:hypothetical protein n=1 Tax=Cesiribacter sp. SM1 TaxID=2861196 RepID=UPI001CD7B057|nr:hypothetical protein [Cesiribacter sp. SM1]